MAGQPPTPGDEHTVEAIATLVTGSLFVLTADGVIKTMAGDGLNAIGLTEAEKGMHVSDVDSPIPDLAENSRRALSGESSTQLVDTPSGSVRTTYTPILDGELNAGAVALVTFENTPSTAEMVEPAAPEQHHRQLSNASVLVAGTRVRDGDLHITDCNQLFLDTLGYDETDVIGEPLEKFLTADSRCQLRSDGFHRAKNNEFVVDERELVAADGRIVRSLLHAVPETDEDGAFIGTRSLYINLTRHDRIQRKLREGKEKIERLHSVATEIARCTDEPSIYRLAIETAEEILEFDICGIDVIEDNYLVPKAISTGMSPDGFQRLPQDEGIAGKTYMTGESFLVDDLREDDEAKPVQDEYRSVISVPIGDIGVFQAVSREIGSYSSDDVRLAELLMSHVAETINRIRSEQALRESEEKYRTLVEQSAEAIYIFQGSEFQFLNNQVTELSGYSEDELYEMPVESLIHPADRHQMDACVDRVEDDGDFPVTFEARILTAAGEIRHCELSITKIQYQGEDAYLGSTRDVTERIEREETLNALQEATRKLMTARTPGEVADLVARTAEDILDYSLGGVWYPNEENDVLELVAATERTHEIGTVPEFTRDNGQLQEVYTENEIRVYNDIQTQEDPQETPIRSLALAPLDNHGVFGVASVSDDEFDESQVDLFKLLATNAETALDRAEREALLREREQELERQNEKLEFLNSLLRHNILNGMTVIIGRTQNLMSAAAASDRDQLETILRWSEDIVDLVRKMRTLMESAVGNADVEPSPVELTPVVETEIEKIRSSYEAATVKSTLQDVVVRGDKMLSEVFENVLSNAVLHHDTASPTIHVTVELFDETAVVEVADNGPGISDDRKNDVLGRGEKGLKSPGTGYGLYLVDTIVSQYGGSVRIEDNEPTGTVVVLELPRAER